MKRVDLNSDMGEGFGAWTMGDDDNVLQFVSSANIACGFHAGDPSVMRRTVHAAAQRGVAIGAHPGLPDLAGFGRRNIDIAPETVYDLVVYQVGAMIGVARHSETLEPLVVYRPLYNATGWWVRPHAMFFETITIDGVARPRFEPVPGA